MGDPTAWRESLRRRTEVVVDDAWKAQIVAGAAGRAERRRARMPVLAFGAALIVIAGGVLGWRAGARHGAPSAYVPAPAPAVAPARLVRLDDAATATLLDERSRAVLVARTPAELRVAVEAGAVRFEVERTGRTFSVQSGAATVVVLGTAFVVERRPDGTRVAVERGRVRVEAGEQVAELGAGEERIFAEPATAAPEAPAPAAEEAPPPGERPRRAAPAWQALARRGEYHQAYRALARGEGPRDDVEELLLAADAARHSEHWAEAIPYYDRVIERHARDPRAALAAFTKARLLLQRLARPADAARAFAIARRLGLAPGLAEDALAYEVEAWHRAGDGERARERAREYLGRHPAGRAAARVRKLAGLDR